jgi:hypothetical protein
MLMTGRRLQQVLRRVRRQDRVHHHRHVRVLLHVLARDPAAPEGSREFVLGHRVDLDLVHGDGDALDPIRAHQHQGGLTPLGLRRLAGEQVHHTEATST